MERLDVEYLKCDKDINHKEIASNLVYSFTNKKPYTLSKMVNSDFKKVTEWINKLSNKKD